MNNWIIIALVTATILVIGGLALAINRNPLNGGRAVYIRAYPFPAALRSKMALKYPELDSAQLDQVFRALRQFFLLCLGAGSARGGPAIGMPSKVVDDAWHEFILMSREYARFCGQAFGAYLHHTPDNQMSNGIEKSLINALQQIKTRNGGSTGWATLAGIPLIFAIDRAYAISGGYYYGEKEMEQLERRRKETNGTTDVGFSFNYGSSGDCTPGSGADCGISACAGGSCGGGGGCGGGCGSD